MAAVTFDDAPPDASAGPVTFGAPPAPPPKQNQSAPGFDMGQSAKAAGIDPKILGGIYHGEGRTGYVGDSGSSFGPFQLHYGGIASGGNRGPGLGDEFTKETGLDARDQSTMQAQADWVAQRLAKNPNEISKFHGYGGPRDVPGGVPPAPAENLSGPVTFDGPPPRPQARPDTKWPGPSDAIAPAIPDRYDPVTQIGEDVRGGVSRIGKGLGELNPFANDRPRDVVGGTLQTGKGLWDVGAGAFQTAVAPYTGATRAGGNVVEKATGGLVPSEQFQFAANTVMPRGAPGRIPETSWPSYTASGPRVMENPASYPSYRYQTEPQFSLGGTAEQTQKAFDFAPEQSPYGRFATIPGREPAPPREPLRFGQSGFYQPPSRPSELQFPPVEHQTSFPLGKPRAETPAGAPPSQAGPVTFEGRPAPRAEQPTPESSQVKPQGPGPLRAKQAEASPEIKQDAKLAGDLLAPKSVGAAGVQQYPTATIKPGRGVWGGQTEGRVPILQQIGQSNRDYARQDAALEQFRRASNKMTPEQSTDLIRYMQHRTEGVDIPDPALKTMADEIRRGYKDLQVEMENADPEARMGFEEDHFAQRWQDPRAAAQVFHDAVGKEGSSQFTKSKKYLDFDAGLAAGLKPKTYNVIDVAANDFANQRRFIASNRIRSVAEEQGFLKWAQSKSGAPSDWVPLKGWGAQKGLGWQAYAPPGFARNYNNFFGRGWSDVSQTAGQIASGLRNVTAGLTGAELGLSGYHALAITKEAFHTAHADALYELAHGHPWSAAKEISKAPLTLPYYLAKGIKANRQWLGKDAGLDMKAIDALTQVNAQMGHIDRALLSGTGGTLWTTAKRGAFQKEFENSVRLVGDAPGVMSKMGTTAREVGAALGNVLNSISAPLFQWVIPNVKRGMMYDGLAKWIAENPGADWDATLAHAHELSNVADERFGEMMQDNLFWNPLVKQTAQIGMRSASWAYGSWTQYLGGLKELKDIPKDGLSRRSSYVLSGLIVEPLVGAMVTYMLTGKGPSQLADFFFPPTGGQVPQHKYGSKNAVDYHQPERLQLPGNVKELVDMVSIMRDASEGDLSGFSNYAYGKLNNFWEGMHDLSTNTQWLSGPNDKLYNPEMPESMLQQYMNWAWNRYAPISVKNAQAGILEGSNIGTAARLAGIRPIGKQWTDPQGLADIKKKINIQDMKRRAAHDKRQKTMTRHEDAAP